METERNLWTLFQMGETMRNIIIFVALLGAAAIFTVLYCLIAAGSQAEKKLTEIMRKEEERNEDK